MKHFNFFRWTHNQGVWCWCLLVTFSGCTRQQKFVIDGRAQGTTYHIAYYSADSTGVKHGVEAVLHGIDLSLSTYNPESIISKVNRNEPVMIDQHFQKVYAKAVAIAQQTGGAFDFTVAPLVNASGFGAGKKIDLNDNVIDSLLQYVGYTKVRVENGRVVKVNPHVQLDFNAIAQGYSVDAIAGFLDDVNIDDYLVELGGEVKAKGRTWKVGIETPTEMETGMTAIVNLENKAIATSGNYRRFYEENGKRFAHIIDPRTGLPGKHNLISASVMAGDCMTADAYATAFMVMGTEKSRKFLNENKDVGLDVFLIYDEGGTWKKFISKGMGDMTE